MFIFFKFVPTTINKVNLNFNKTCPNQVDFKKSISCKIKTFFKNKPQVGNQQLWVLDPTLIFAKLVYQ